MYGDQDCQMCGTLCNNKLLQNPNPNVCPKSINKLQALLNGIIRFAFDYIHGKIGLLAFFWGMLINGSCLQMIITTLNEYISKFKVC
jgi:hypothetical protein